ncbi:polysaccharide biosynthesis tyrosine autokinase [Dactylosporangium sp. NPDC006015]|uniref:polysaccharide biosynthesis tyrosine autokinase n=1 Tax=Dactylosporangium sp. NPDC006015 TaxID=3154576 RepID=UPI0033B529B1
MKPERGPALELRSILPLLRERWKSVVATVLAAIAVGMVLTARQTPWYEARTTLFVSAWADGGDAAKAYQADLLSQQKVKSYSVIVRDKRVMRSVIDKLDLTVTPDALAARVSTDTLEDTVLLTIRVTDTSPQQAQRITDAVADEFIRLVPTLEATPDGSPSPVHVSVVSPADLPGVPVSPRPLHNLALATLAGLLAGAALATVRHAMDTSIKTTEQAEEITGTSLLGVIPRNPDQTGIAAVTEEDSSGRQVEAYRQVQTSMQFMDADRRTKVVVVTSSVPAEGKSVTSCNLALSIAESGRSVLLIDADLRRPQAAGYLGVPSGAGLTSVLIGQAELDDVIQPWGDTSLSVLASGPVPPNPSKLIGSNHMRRLLDELRSRYDMVIIDTPPVLPVADAIVLSALSDGAIFVVRHGHTRRDQVCKATAALRRAEVDVLGFILNMTPRRTEDAYNYYDAYSAGHAATSVGTLAGRLTGLREKIAIRL